MRAFTLLELVVVLAVVYLVLSLVFPQIYNSSLSGEESFKNRFTSLLVNSFSFNGGSELCVDFKREVFSVGGKEVKLPYRPESVVFPGKLVSGELASKYCFVPSGATLFVLNLKKGDGYLSVMVLLPMGESKFYSLKESEEETLKDKVEKGRVGEWFSYYWY